ncbi:MAG: isochorismatase family protein [Ancalomicrobiaceae bacterium]|nr:isochorismatase family protein [Ancalomicrobiaceae bacterium]
MTESFAGIVADPYHWPFDGAWSAADTAMLLLGFQAGPVEALSAETEAACALKVAKVAGRRGIALIASRRGTSCRVSPTDGLQWRADACPAPGSPDWQLVASLAALPLAGIIDHPGDNAFFATPLEQILRSRGIRNLLFAGLPTDGLLHATQRTANDMGFECLAIADGCKGTTTERHFGQLRITTFGNGLFGAVASSGAVLGALGAEDRSSETFKETPDDA